MNFFFHILDSDSSKYEDCRYSNAEFQKWQKMAELEKDDSPDKRLSCLLSAFTKNQNDDYNDLKGKFDLV